MSEYLIIQNEISRRAQRRERIFRDRNNPLEIYDDIELLKRFRFPAVIIENLVRICSPYLSRSTFRNNPLPPIIQITSALRFYAKGLFQTDNGDTCGITQSSISKSITAVTNILCQQRSNYIHFPSTPEEKNMIKMKTYEVKGFPNVIGLIDGTHIKLAPPSNEEEKNYVCKGGGHSINVQIISDSEMKILDVVARFPGSTHDSYIWNQCSLREKFINENPNGYLLGDSGYGVEPWLMTPLLTISTEAERKYNIAHKGTRRIVENTIGLLKSTFRCIDKSGGKLLYKPAKVCKIIISCTVLHNIRRSLRLDEDENFISSIEDEPDQENQRAYEGFRQNGILERRRLIENHFS